MFESKLKFVYLGILLISLVVTGGTIGYVLIEGVHWLDAFYMTVITVSTVGYGEVFELSSVGRMFTILLIMLGTGTLAYTAAQMVDYIVAGEIGRIFGRRKMRREIEKLKDHYIICGFGRMGKVIAESLKSYNKPFVIIDADEELTEFMSKNKYLFKCGDATKEETLLDVNILDAKGLITVVDSDVKNLYIVLSSKGLKQDLHVVAKAAAEEAYSKMFWAGADKVVSPYMIGGLSIANSIVKPTVSEFIDLALGNTDYNIEVEEIKIEEGSKLDGVEIKESNIRSYGLIVIAIKKKTGAFIYNPGPEVALSVGDKLVCLGRKEDFESFENDLKKGK